MCASSISICKVFGVSLFFFQLFNWSKMTVKSFIMSVLNFLFIKESWGKNTMFFNKNINWHCLRRILIIIINIC